MTFETIRTQVQKNYLETLRKSTSRKISISMGIIFSIIYTIDNWYKGDIDIVLTAIVFLCITIFNLFIFELMPLKINAKLTPEALDKMTVEYIESEIEDYEEYRKSIINKISKNNQKLKDTIDTIQEYNTILKPKVPTPKIFTLGDTFLYDSITDRRTGDEYAKTIDLLNLLQNGYRVKIVIDEKIKSINDTFIKGMFNEVSKVFTADEIKEKVEIVGDNDFINLFKKNWIILEETNKK